MTMHDRRDIPSPEARPGAAGFTLMELVFAMAIFAVGLTVAASFFPTATFLHRRAFETTVSEQVGKSGAAILMAEPVPPPSSDGEVEAISDMSDWPVTDRSYPQRGELAVNDRQFYWLPLRGRFDGEERVFVFVCARQGDVENYAALEGAADAVVNSGDNSNVPRVARFAVSSGSYDATKGQSTLTMNNAEDFVEPGDPLLLNTGAVIRVTRVDGNTISFAGRVDGLGAVDAIWIGLTHERGRPGPGRHVEVVGGEAMQ